MLLYPRWDKNEPKIQQFYLNNDNYNYRINFKTINLQYDDIKNNLDKIKIDIMQILNAA